jgi:hypothetical protein
MPVFKLYLKEELVTEMEAGLMMNCIVKYNLYNNYLTE